MRESSVGHVYFIHSPVNNLVKIGWTGRGPDRRLAQLRVTCPVPLNPLGTLPGDKVQERKIHAFLAEEWSHGEWYRGSERLWALVNELTDPWDPVRFHPYPIVARTMPRFPLEDWHTTKMLTRDGVTKTVAEWVIETNISIYTFYFRLMAKVENEELWSESYRFPWHTNIISVSNLLPNNA